MLETRPFDTAIAQTVPARTILRVRLATIARVSILIFLVAHVRGQLVEQGLLVSKLDRRERLKLVRAPRKVARSLPKASVELVDWEEQVRCAIWSDPCQDTIRIRKQLGLLVHGLNLTED